MAVTAAPHGRVPGCVDVEQGKIYRQVSAGMELNLLCFSQSKLVALINSPVNQEAQRIHCCGPCSGALVRPTQSSVDHYEDVRLPLSMID